MRKLVQKLKSRMARFTLIPTDHYTVLGLARHATTTDIEMACAAAMASDPERILAARRVLLDPTGRKEYDQHLETLWVYFANPPH